MLLTFKVRLVLANNVQLFGFVTIYLPIILQYTCNDIFFLLLAEIVRLVKHEPQDYTIHYLMGCHSTPLSSHLHTPNIKFETWTLDCSPQCRADPKHDCESDRFLKDPVKFVEDEYFHCTDFEDGICVSNYLLFYPDFLMTSSKYVPLMKPHIISMGLKEVGRFINSINGIKFQRWIIGYDAFSNPGLRKVSLLSSDFIQLSLEDIVLFQNKDINPRY